jgi:uncharacterized membrane protein YphA (DoxX/SURF4 family)
VRSGVAISGASRNVTERSSGFAHSATSQMATTLLRQFRAGLFAEPAAGWRVGQAPGRPASRPNGCTMKDVEDRSHHQHPGHNGAVPVRVPAHDAPRGGDARRWLLWLATAARLLLAAVWAWAAVAKITDPDAAVRAVRAYQLLPEAVVRPVAWGLPFVELALGVLLVVGLATRLAAVCSAVLLGVFMVGIASAWARGLQIHCGCFGGGGPSAGVGARDYLVELVRDTGLLAVAVLLARHPHSRLAVDRHLTSEEP